MHLIFRYSEATACFSWKPTGCSKGFSTRSRRLEKDMRRRGAFSLYWDSNAVVLFTNCFWERMGKTIPKKNTDVVFGL